jgi:hypothetical protein
MEDSLGGGAGRLYHHWEERRAAKRRSCRLTRRLVVKLELRPVGTVEASSAARDAAGCLFLVVVACEGLLWGVRFGRGVDDGVAHFLIGCIHPQRLRATDQAFRTLDFSELQFCVLNQLSNDFLALRLPLRPVVESVGQELVARDTKDEALLELLGEWNLSKNGGLGISCL